MSKESVFDSSFGRTRSAMYEDDDTIMNEKRKWEWTFLREKCNQYQLEPFLKTYLQRLRSTHLTLFIIIHWSIVFFHCFMLELMVTDTRTIYIDMAVYCLASILICIIIIFCFNTNFMERHTYIKYFMYWIIVVILIAMDVSIIFLDDLSKSITLRPAYSYYVIIVSYMFIPFRYHLQALTMGIFVTIAYMISISISSFIDFHIEEGMPQHRHSYIVEIIYLACLNVIGLYTRLTKEITILTTFLDRRQCVEESLLFRYARDQENGLLLSILPVQIANKIEQDMKLRIESQKRLSPEGGEFLVELRKLFIEPHNDVTILYADLVNYTYLTTQLDVKTLVETIHDLFVKFDIASQRHNVLRIKFLGDCYYCVSGVPIPNEYHAKCCVDLGLCMINDIREVSMKRQLDIDMRIGVHSGSILSGVIGARKWQYDIWSKDVDIANRLEATGVAGRVHVSEQTLKQLDGAYMYEEGTEKARNDEILRKYEIHTYLIIPSRASLDLLQPAVNLAPDWNRLYNQQSAQLAFTAPNSVESTEIRLKTNLEMSKEIDHMPVGRIELLRACCSCQKRYFAGAGEEQALRKNITPLFLFFKDWRREIFYLNEPDGMLKYSLLVGILIFWCIAAMQVEAKSQGLTFWFVTIIASILMINCIIVAWYRKIWIMFFAKNDNSLPERKISVIMFLLSEKFQCSVIVRTVVYILLIGSQITVIMVQMIDCNINEVMNNAFLNNVENRKLFFWQCFYPWAVTNGWTLSVCTVFVFTRIPFIVKILLGVSLIGFFCSAVFYDYDSIFERTITTNFSFPPEMAHVMVPIITGFIFFLMDRQSEFISKVDFDWKRQLLKKQIDAKFTNETIKVLINNILPSHVAEIYMRKQIKHELYYEEYDNVACMFATICNYDTENFGLRVLNEIICDFDEILSFYGGNSQVEKIKVAGWTYMAACGLHLKNPENVVRQYIPDVIHDPLRRLSNRSSYSNNGSELSHIDMPLMQSRRRSSHLSPPQHTDVVYVMTKFALDMIRTLHIFNTETLQIGESDGNFGKLRIGISNGEVMAGVVGSYKPHYDIWGNAVNMASRMDSTGIPGMIQVTENTANILKTYGIQCTYRGLTFVKGRGETPTYFVGIDKELNFIHNADIDV